MLGKWIKTERLNQIQILKENKNKLLSKIDNIKIEINDLEQLSINLETSITECNKKIEKLNVKLLNKENEIETLNSELEINNKNLQDKGNQLKKIKEQVTVIDDDFWKKFDSVDNVDVQVSNPWITKHFNREREKLFYYALQLHKEFILSSKACKDNIKNLSMMWKFEKNNNNEIPIFDVNDKKASYAHLLNTLFLIIPVISTTFASVGRFLKDIDSKGSLGTLIIDEAGQAAPHVALGALWRCKKAIIVGDPKQVEPVVTDDADVIKKALCNEIIKPYKDKSISVQEFADKINNYGSYIKDSSENETWVGCPLIVHRRCISPMFDISNEISYGGTMKNKTFKPKNKDEIKFVYDKSCWIDVSGSEKGNKNHFVISQGEKALEIIEESFAKYNGFPDLYVISPFTTVINGLRDLLKKSTLVKKYDKNTINTWLENNCGTVHKFQGKEAKEVIFLLGCDKKAMGAVRWVKPNILNVAATRAKYRFYIIGDYEVWKQSKIFEIAKNTIDNYN